MDNIFIKSLPKLLFNRLIFAFFIQLSRATRIFYQSLSVHFVPGGIFLKILITGSKGQLGNELTAILKNKASEIGAISPKYADCKVIAADVDMLDITNAENVNSFLEKNRPDIVVNCAAMTNVDGCETNFELAMKVNALGPLNLARACKKINAKLVHISTDYVFAGNGKSPYREWDICAPDSIYGKSKLLGEQYVREQTDKYFIIRTAWLYGYVGKNFVKTILNLAKEKSQIKVVNDQIGNPTNANDLAHHILKIALTDNYGIYHCTGAGEASWFEFASLIVKYAQLDCQIVPCSTDEFPREAKRPQYSSLDNLMLRCTVGDEMRPWQDALFIYINKLKKENIL